MRFFISILTLIINVNCSVENRLVNRVLFIQNDYLREKINQCKTENRHLYSISVEINDIERFLKNDKGPLIDIYYNSKNEKYVFVLDARASSYILSTINFKKGIILSFQYKFTDSSAKIDERKLYTYDSLKILTGGPKGSINVENDNCFGYSYHIKQIYFAFIHSKFIILENLESVLEDDFVYQPLKFKLRHFKSLYSCFESYKEFLIFLNFLNLEEDNRTLFFSKKISNNNNKFRASYFEKYLRERLYKDYFENKNTKPSFLMSQQWILTVFKQCGDELVDNILSNKIMLPIKGDFTVDFYLDKFYLLIKEVIEKLIQKIDPFSKEDCAKKCNFLVKSFVKKAIKLSKEIAEKSWESLDAIDFFSKILGRGISNVNDCIEIDRLMCDFYNMIACVAGIRDNLEDSKLVFINPMLVDNNEFRVTKGFEIILENPLKLEEIKAYKCEENFFLLEKDIDYFVKVVENGLSIRFPIEKFKKEGIQFIEILATEQNLYKKLYFYLDKVLMI